MANQSLPTNITAIPGSSPSNLLAELTDLITAQSKLKEEQKRLEQDQKAISLQWTKDMAKEVVKGVNLQGLVARVKDFESKEQRFKEQGDALVRSLDQIDETILHFEKEHKTHLISALQFRMEQVGVACREYSDLEEWRDRLVGRAKAKPKPKARQKSKAKREV